MQSYLGDSMKLLSERVYLDLFQHIHRIHPDIDAGALVKQYPYERVKIDYPAYVEYCLIAGVKPRRPPLTIGEYLRREFSPASIGRTLFTTWAYMMLWAVIIAIIALLQFIFG